MNPATSIIVPAHNASRFLADTIRSVQSQTVSDWELVIVDDGSRDNTADLARRFANDDPRISVAVQPNAGPASARNRGFKEASPLTSTLLFLDADDILLPSALETLRGALAATPEAVVVYGLAAFMDERGLPIREGESARWTQARRIKADGLRVRTLDVDAALDVLSLVCCNSIQAPGTALLRRDAFVDVAGFDPAIRITEDWDLWIRLSERGPIRFVSEVVLAYRLHSQSFSASRTALRAAEQDVRDKTLGRLRDPERRAAIRAIKSYERSLALSKVPLSLEAFRQGRLRGGFIQVIYGVKHLKRSLPGVPVERTSPTRTTHRV
jgi:glycosyltransferase involved in cell wall biosynthesis